MARQVIQLPASSFDVQIGGEPIDWLEPAPRTQITSALAGGAIRYFFRVQFLSNGHVRLFFDNTPNGSGGEIAGEDLSDKFEEDGGFTIEAGEQKLTVLLDGADTNDPYLWTPDNAAEVTTFFNAFRNSPDGTVAATFTLFDARIPEMAYNALTAQEWSYSHPTLGALDIQEAAFNDVVLL